jgi:hypothetical protein
MRVFGVMYLLRCIVWSASYMFQESGIYVLCMLAAVVSPCVFTLSFFVNECPSHVLGRETDETQEKRLREDRELVRPHVRTVGGDGRNVG